MADTLLQENTTSDIAENVGTFVVGGGNLPVIQLNNQSLIDPNKFNTKAMAWCNQKAQELDFNDTNAVLCFAAEPQRQLNTFLDTILENVKVKEAGALGDLAITLTKGISFAKVKEFQQQIVGGKSWLTRLPLVGRLWDVSRAFIARQSSLRSLLTEVEKQMITRQHSLMKRNIELDQVFDNTMAHINKMALWIISGERALRLGQEQLQMLKDKTIRTPDMTNTQRANDLQEQVTLFEVRLSDMKVAYVRSMSSGVQIRTVQQANKIELQNVIQGLLSDIVAFKQALVLTVANYNTMLAQHERKKQAEVLKTIEEANIAAIRHVYLEAKTSQGRSLMEATHITGLANKLIETLQLGVQIEKDNVNKRKEAEKILVQTQEVLRRGLAQVGQNLPTSSEADVGDDILLLDEARP